MTRPVVTKHAMVRYLERKRGEKVKRLCRDVRKAGDFAVVNALVTHHGLDVPALIDEMLAQPVVEAFEAGAKAIKHDGVKFVFDNGHLVTVTPVAGPRARRW